METTTLKISGMTCMGCVNSVTRVLKATPGVADARVTLDPRASDGAVRRGANESGATQNRRGRCGV